ncbi:MAG: LytTR family DNA-binding domain-containing protein [Muribaculaceae bacterium]|nr:LytTR family DNA-binding domain-containing protein [Muribaculaceae bacterium]
MGPKTLVAIIDDDIKATENLKSLLLDYPDLDIIWNATSLTEGKMMIASQKPDLLFLDIELPDGIGIDFINTNSSLLKNTYIIIFTGYYDSYSDNAFTHNEHDYVLKPVIPKELDKSIQRFRHTNLKKRISSSKNDIESSCLPPDTFATFTPMNEIRIVRIPEIGYFRYSSNRRIWEAALKDRTFVQLKKGTKAEDILSLDSLFIQTHQSYIVNLRYLTLISNAKCVLFPPFDIDEILLSRIFKSELQKKFTSI